MMQEIGTCVVVDSGPNSGCRAWCLRCEQKSHSNLTEVDVAEWIAQHSGDHYAVDQTPQMIITKTP